jgi:hypothetical protein
MRVPNPQAAGAGGRAAARLAALIAGIAVGLGLLAPGPVSAKIPEGFFGLDTVHQPSLEEFQQMKRNGGDAFRIQVLWRAVEPERPMDIYGQKVRTYDFSRSDAEMRNLVAAGLTPHVTLIGSPGWVGSFATSPLQSKEGREGWPAYVAAVVKRYGPDGSFWRENPLLPVTPPDIYQIWNEPNSQIAYEPAANPREYAKLFKLAAFQIDRHDPRAKVIPGGMFGTPQLEDSLYAWPFIDKFLSVRGVPRYVDGVAVHPYAKGLRGVKYQVRKVRSTVFKAGFRKMPLYITELGWSSEEPNGNIFYKGVKGQAKAVKRALGLIMKNRRKWRLKRVLWFTWSDVTRQQAWSSGCGFCQKMGLVNTDLAAKPALASWRKYAMR